jgi:hypothetical protein
MLRPRNVSFTWAGRISRMFFARYSAPVPLLISTSPSTDWVLQAVSWEIAFRMPQVRVRQFASSVGASDLSAVTRGMS